MRTLLGYVVLADAQKSIGYVLAILLIVGFFVAVFFNMRRGHKEVGAEIELAPNRKPYYDDDELETKKLDRTLALGAITLGVIAVALPLYWLAEPGRMDDAIETFNASFVNRGEALYDEGAQCAACHGPKGVGGVANYTITAPNGDFVAQVDWQAPALDTVLYRYSREEVKYILEYGRPFSPMPAWGAAGGGPLTDQQLENLMDYLQEIQLPATEVREMVDEELAETCAPDDAGNCTLPDAEFATMGEAIFNMGLYTQFAGGAFSCGRCHTGGWSYGDPGVPGGGAFGPALNGGRTLRQFPTAEQQEDFVIEGSVAGAPYGRFGQSGAGMMPGFGLNPNVEPPEVPGPIILPMEADQVMLTPEQIAAVVAYERSL
jgi:mono/diheme cytochrome c family protein